MKLFFTFLLTSFFYLANAQSQSPKPGILINGNPCLIGNTVYSCTPKACDTITINAGDSIEFCTGQQIFLNTDTAYFMQWNFSGSNYSGFIQNNYPTNTPVCYSPRWDSAGTFQVDVFYNGWLSAYPSSDCYSFGPSHWIIQVNVLSLNGISTAAYSEFQISPNPSNGDFLVSFPSTFSSFSISVIDVFGNQISKQQYAGKTALIDLNSFTSGIYFLSIQTEKAVYTSKIVKE